MEAALALALKTAAEAGDTATVARIVAELEARRRERAGVASLDVERAKRNGKR
ncbi:MAG TPA: hypothetical protein VF989_14365 [Polyangiaceae bacterium]